MGQMGEDSVRAVEFFKVLAHPTRRRLLELIAAGQDVARGTLEESTGLPADMASYHLRVLVAADLVELRRRGREVSYALRHDTVAEVVDRIAAFAEDSRRPVRGAAPAAQARVAGSGAGAR